MKYIIIVTFLLSSAMAMEGRDIFDKKCASCHRYEVKRADFNKVKASLKAPPMNEISRRVKKRIKVYFKDIHRFVVVSFLKEYMKHPSFDYYMCDDKAIARYDIMPAMKNMTEEEYQVVSEWIYDNYSIENYEATPLNEEKNITSRR
jgi:hypothetical protein